MKFVKAFPETRIFFIFPPSVEDLEKRLIARGTETEETLKTRVGNASSEIRRGISKDDPDHLIGYRLINSDVENAKKLFVKLFECFYSEELKVNSWNVLDKQIISKNESIKEVLIIINF